MSARSFTILETVLAAILAMLLMIGSVGVIQNMQRETTRFKTQVDNDTTWMNANIHLAKMVRSSSYLELPNANTLILHNYDGTEKGRYVYNANSHRIEYWVTNNTTLQTMFNNVEATFALKAGAQRNGQPIEAIINYTRPFANMLYLRCAVATPGPASSTWAIAIGTVGDVNNVPYYIIQTADRGYAIVGYTSSFGAGRHDVYFVKVNNQGQREWSRTYGTSDSDEGWAIAETFNAAGVPDGFIIAGRTEFGSTVLNPILIRTDTVGNPLWQRDYPRPGGPSRSATPTSVCEVRNARTGGSPLGYAMATYGQMLGDGFAEIARMNLDGTVVWFRRLTYANPNHHNGIQNENAYYMGQIFNAAGASDGYVVTGETWKYYGNNVNHDTIFVMRVNDSGGYVWSRMYPRMTSYYNTGRFADRVYNISGAPDGFVIGGNISESYLVMDAFILRLNDSGNKLWSAIFPNHGAYWGDWYRKTWKATTGFTTAAQTTEPTKNRPYVINTTNIGASTAPLFMEYPSAYTFVNVKLPAIDMNGNFDGYILLGRFGKGATGANNGRFLIIKTDLNGKCPATEPTAVPDTPTSHAIAYTDTGGAASDINMYGNPGNIIDSF